MDKSSKLFKERVEARLNELGWDQKTLAKKLGVKPPSVSQALVGNPGIETIFKYAEALDCQPWELIKSDDSTNSEAKVVENPELLNRILAVWGTFNKNQRRLLAENAEAFAARINPASQSTNPVSKHKKAGT